MLNLRDVLEIDFPSPATHEKSVSHTAAPLSISNVCVLILITSGGVCVCHKEADKRYSAHFSIFSLSVLVFLIGLFTEKIIRITKMAELSALSNGFNLANPFIPPFSLSLLHSFFFPTPLHSWARRAACLFAVAVVINASASLGFREEQKKS